MHHTKYLRKTVGSRVFDIFNIIFMILFMFIMIYPFYNQFILSLNDGADAARGGIYFFPRKFSTSAYEMLFSNSNLIRGSVISILRVVVGTVTCLLTTGLLAYIVTIKNFSGRKFMRILFIVTMYFGGGLIPFYLLIVKLKMINTFSVYWIPNLINAYYMLLIASYIQNIPDSLVEAARIDGASELKIYIKLIIPLCKPVLAAISVYLAVGHWNSWFDVLIYNPAGKWDTLQVYLRRLLLEVEALEKIRDAQLARTKFRNLSPMTLRAATTMLVTLPILIVYPFFQRYFVGGITIGAVKE